MFHPVLLALEQVAQQPKMNKPPVAYADRWLVNPSLITQAIKAR
jgi:hypothetical protein